MTSFHNPKYSRREFINFIGAGMATLTFGKFQNVFAKDNVHLPQVAVQLYSVRRELEKDYQTTLKNIADIGYYGVETYALPENLTLQTVSSTLKSLELSVVAMHVDYPFGNTSLEDVLRMSEAYNCDIAVYAGWPEGEKYSSKESMERTTEQYAIASGKLFSHGIKFALHNHWFEFEPHSGEIPFLYLLKKLPPSILFEIDVYWAQTGGADPIKILSKFGDRAPLLHIKDGPATKEAMYRQVPAGKGSIDFPAIFKASKNNVRYAIVEFDEYDGDIFDGLKMSYDYLVNNNFVKGRE